MFTIDEYRYLSSKYGPYASWAVWDDKNSRDTEIIGRNFDQLHSRFVLLGLNISRPLSTIWSNFHDNTHARKIKYASNYTKLRGSYTTDIFKGIVKNRSDNFESLLTKEKILEDVIFFNQEMADIKIDQNTQFIIFGVPNSAIAHLFNMHFKQYFANKIIYYTHYANFRLTDKEWVEGFWKTLNINQNYDHIIYKFKKKLITLD